MRVAPWLLAGLVLFADPVSTQALNGAARYETTVQYALENLRSGIEATAVFADTKFTVVPLRTWKSVSGTYCRRYEYRMHRMPDEFFSGEQTRCRDGNGTWRVVRE